MLRTIASVLRPSIQQRKVISALRCVSNSAVDLSDANQKAEERIYGAENKPWADGFDAFVLANRKGEAVWGSHAETDGKKFVPQRTVVASRLWALSDKVFVLPENDPTKNSSLKKTFADSFTEVIIPFGSDKILRDQYVTSNGNLQFGLLLEDLDAFAGHIAYKHCENPETPNVHSQVIVTASVNRIDLLNKLHPNRDLRFRGCVTWVGRSSMNVSIKVSSCKTGISSDSTKPRDWSPIISANFTMVARCPTSSTAVAVPRLQITNNLEQIWFDEGEESHKAIMQSRESSIFKKPPTEIESQLIHTLYMENQVLKSGKNDSSVKYMETTNSQSVVLCHPQERNIHNKIFGGFLMRQAYDLAFTTAFMYVGERPFFLAMDDISFLKPVEIGSICDFKSKIVYAQGSPSGSLQVQVSAEVVNPKLNTRDVTNVFHFIFASPSTPVKKLMPETYSEFVVYLDAMRRHVRGRDKRVASALVQSY